MTKTNTNTKTSDRTWTAIVQEKCQVIDKISLCQKRDEHGQFSRTMTETKWKFSNIFKYLPHSGFDGYQFWSLPIKESWRTLLLLRTRVFAAFRRWTLVHVGPKIFGGLRPLYRGFKALCRNSCYRPTHRIRVSSGPLDVLIGAYPYWAWEVCDWWWMLSFFNFDVRKFWEVPRFEQNFLAD